MSGAPRPLERLDPAVAFVAAIDRVLQGETGVDEAALVLRAFMERHGVYVICELPPMNWTRNEDFSRVNGALRLQALLRASAGLGLQRAWYPSVDDDDDDLLESGDYAPFERERLFPFLSETLLLIDGSAFSNDHTIVFTQPGFADPLVEGFGSWYSMRGWGETLAEWAEWAGWIHRSGRALTYVDFYIGDCGGLEDHAVRTRLMLQAIRQVTRQLCVEASVPVASR